MDNTAPTTTSMSFQEQLLIDWKTWFDNVRVSSSLSNDEDYDEDYEEDYEEPLYIHY